MTYTSSIGRLKGLPGAIHRNDLIEQFGWPPKTASQYLYMWQQRGLVEAFGGHSNVYLNTLSATPSSWDAVLKLAMPSAIIIGVEAIRRAAWTTQIPRSPEVAVRKGETSYQTDRFVVTPMPAAWFNIVEAGIDTSRKQVIPVLRPGWALADLVTRFGWDRSPLHEDDIDADNGDFRTHPDYVSATKALQDGQRSRQRNHLHPSFLPGM